MADRLPSDARASVVIPTRGRAEHLLAVIAPVLADSATAEVLVVVDGRDDASVLVLKQAAARDDRLRVLRLVHNQGAAAARDHGVRSARERVVLVLDDDVLAGPGLVSGHVAQQRGEPGRVVVGYMPVGGLAATRATTRLYAASYEATCRRWRSDDRAILTSLWAGNLSMRTADARRVGFASTVRLDYHADLDMGLRCRAAGLSGVFDDRLRATHLYDRDLEGVLADAAAQGRDLAALHARHPSCVPLPPEGRLRLLLERPRTADRASRVLRGGVRTAEALRLDPAVARLLPRLVRLERHRAVRAARADGRSA